MTRDKIMHFEDENYLLKTSDNDSLNNKSIMKVLRPPMRDQVYKTLGT